MQPFTRVRWNGQQLRTALRHELQPNQLIPSITAGLIAGVFLIIYAASFGALIFSGELAPFVSAGIGFVLFTAIAVSITVALTSSLPGVLIIPQDAPAIITALMVSAIMAQMPSSASATERFATVVITIALTSLLVGIICLLLGAFKLGNLTRFAPYPVVGGFLAGTGYLIAQGAFSLMTDRFFNIFELGTLLQPEFLIRWLPGSVFGVLLLLILRRYDHVLIIPGMTVGGTLLFYLGLWLTQTSIAEARNYGLLLQAFPTGALWQPIHPAMLLQAQWSLISEQTVRIITIIMLCVMMLLLNATGIELATRKDIDLNQELRAVGLANIIAGLGGGIVGFHGLGLSTLCYAKIGAKSRLVGVLAALVCIVTLFAGGFMSLIPKAVLGGMLLFLGLGFLVEWIYDARLKLPKIDYLLMLLILLVMALVGFLEGVGLGLAIAIILFVINYSQINVAKYAFSGVSYQSHAARSLQEQRVLRQEGDQTYILDLQGFLFFGTASTLLNQIQHQLQRTTESPIKFVILNFRSVAGLDSSAVLAFEKLKQIAQKQSFQLVFTQLSAPIQQQLQRGGVVQPDDPVCQVFPDLDRGVEWCENQILEAIAWRRKKSLPLVLQLDSWFPDETYFANIIDYLEELDVDAGYVLFHQGETATALYIIEFGQVTIWAESNSQTTRRVQTLGSGSFVGEMEFFSGIFHHTSGITDTGSTLYRLSQDAFVRMREESPQTAIAFQKAINCLLAERLSYAYQEIDQLLS
ncbi:MAG: SLC26A/SulP transporter family protein [Leptolyngbyaceae cyanobacterium SL_7_1]|nr:SLC26A/SulP transporter family protein [Leptolyngbyaceae cyanobacterium SL_7_1]